MSCMDNGNIGGAENHNNHGECSRFFPDTLKELLKELACEWVVITFVNGCKERVRIECVTDKLLVVREQNTFRFISIDCICSVSANSDTILDSLLNSHCD